MTLAKRTIIGPLKKARIEVSTSKAEDTSPSTLAPLAELAFFVPLSMNGTVA